MKILMTLLLSVALLSSSAFAQKISADKVPAAVSSAFNKKFPTATKIIWSMENKTEYEAEFMFNGEGVSANFDNTGKWLETEIEMKVTDLPETIKTALTKDFDGYRVKEASKMETDKYGKCFEVEIQKGEERFDVLYSADGKILNKEKVQKEKGEKKD